MARMFLDSQVVGFQLEMPLVHLYKETWSLNYALVYMGDAGFVLAQLTTVPQGRLCIGDRD